MKKPMRVKDFAALQAWLETRLGAIRCVSFDVFDTLLARCIEPPDDIQRRVAALLAEKIGGITPDAAFEARRAVEWELRRAALSDGLDHECHFDPLVEGWVTRLAGHPDPALVGFVHRTERELESLALTAKPGALALLEWLQARGVRVIAVSDMYLSHDYLAALLADCGLDGLLDRLYVSSEFGLGKYSGRLHARMLELEGQTLEGLTPAQVVHVGDNLVPDMRAPMQLGIRGIYLDERAERLRRRRQTLSAEMAALGGVWRGRRFFEIVDFRMRHDAACQSACEDFFHHYGAHVLGPAFSAFLLGLVEKIGAVKPDKLFFLARDGYLFEKMYARWRVLQPDVENWPEPVYVYASRRVVATASVAEGLSPEQAVVAFYNPKQQGLFSVLKTFGLPAEDFAELACEHGFTDLTEPMHDWRDTRLLAFLADERVQSRIRPIGEAARDRLRRYFEQHGFFACERVALVDIGWNGTIQKFLRDSFGSRPDYPDVHGWYFAFVAAMHGDFGMGDSIEGLIQDVRRGDPYERAPMDFEEIFEQGARSGEGTTLGYIDAGGRVVPVLKDDAASDRQGEIACNSLIARFQAGVLDHLTHFHAAWRLTGYTLDDIKPYVLALLERAVVYPTREEVAEISHLVHTEDFGHDHTLDMAATPVGYFDWLRPRRLYRKLRHLPWKYAAFVHFSSTLPAWLFRLVCLANQRRR
jgi:FMN phosphatase YigB (HAD superfamily)